MELIVSVARSEHDQKIMIVDALDECRDAYELLDFLERIHRKSQNIRFFLSSRLSLHVSQGFDRCKVISHFDSAADIKNYVTHEVNSHKRRARSGMTSEQATHLEDLLLNRAGMM